MLFILASPENLVEIQAVPDNELVGDGKTYVVPLEAARPRRALL